MEKYENTSDVSGARGNDPVPNHGLKAEFPLLWEMAVVFAYAERLGGCPSALHAEVDAAMRELWMARNAASLVTP